jgi:acetyl esterase/lipase
VFSERRLVPRCYFGYPLHFVRSAVDSTFDCSTTYNHIFACLSSYRLSPQHPYPQPLDDCLAVVEYVMQNAEELRIDPERIAVGGDSAGGNMAASISLRLKRRIALQLLIVPVLQMFNFNTTSFLDNRFYFNQTTNSHMPVVFVANYFGINSRYAVEMQANMHTSPSLKKSRYAEYVDQRKWMSRDLIRNHTLRTSIGVQTHFGDEDLSDKLEDLLLDPYAAPLMADDYMLSDLPEAYIVTCGYDFLRDDGVMYEQRLRSVGSKVTLVHYPDGYHNSLLFPHGPLKLDVSHRMVTDIVRVLKEDL